MAPAPITDALVLVEVAILAALRERITGEVHWEPAPTDTTRRLALPPTNAQWLPLVAIAQHQDDGGRQQPLLNSLGWTGLVVVRVRSRDPERASTGFALAVEAMGALTRTETIALTAIWVKPRPIPTVDQIVTRAGLWRVTLRRAPS